MCFAAVASDREAVNDNTSSAGIHLLVIDAAFERRGGADELKDRTRRIRAQGAVHKRCIFIFHARSKVVRVYGREACGSQNFAGFAV